MKLGMMGSGMIVTMALNVLKRIDGITCAALWHRQTEGEAAAKLQEDFGVPRLYTDMEAFLADPSFDTVYVGVINSLHYAYTKQALLAGKNVICEKPFMSDGSQAKELIGLAKEKGLFLFEAILSRYDPNHQAIRENLSQLGAVKLIQCNYSQYSSRYDRYRQGIVLPAFDPHFCGGCLYDINVYCVHFVIGLFGRPQSVHYFANKGPNGIDTSGVLILTYENFQAVCCGAKDSNSPAVYMVQGEEGYIRLDNRPGVREQVTLVKNKQEPVRINVDEGNDLMGTEFRAIAAIMAAKDYDLAHRYLQTTLEVMDVMEEARLQVGIHFDR
ncbi:MAG: Gfo/Idh/MocA family oxidoreductase [Lachnospiraceae bacterium]|nr:Gfo/Idh/MocA family oxidoreductase [Lachnospiraceae bacterium]